MANETCDNCHRIIDSDSPDDYLCSDCAPVELVVHASVSRDEWEAWQAQEAYPAYVILQDSCIGVNSLQLDGSSVEEVQGIDLFQQAEVALRAVLVATQHLASHEERDYWRQTLERALTCGLPNLKENQ